MAESSFRERATKTVQRLGAFAGAGKLLGRLGRRDVEVRELIEIVEGDPFLAGKVLQLANSGTFGRLRGIQTVNHAVAFLGPSVLRRHALKWTVGSVFNRFASNSACTLTKFTMHSEAVANLTDTLCDHLDVCDADGAFTAGLLHDVGRLVIANTDADLAEETIFHHMNSGRPMHVCERELLGIDHAELSAVAASMWRLPESICEVLQFHHDPLEFDYAGGRSLPLTLVIRKANKFVNTLGLSITPEPVTLEPLLEIPGHEAAVAEALKAFEQNLRHKDDESDQ